MLNVVLPGGVHELEGPEARDGPLAQGGQPAPLPPPQDPRAPPLPQIQTRPNSGTLLILITFIFFSPSFFASGVGFPLHPEIFYIITQ